MPLLDNLFSPHLNNLQRALGRSTERQSLLVGNLANVNVAGFKRRDIDFHVALENETTKMEARAQEMKQRSTQLASDNTSIRADGNNVDLEREVMSIAETELHYQALTDLTASYFSGLKNVIREGR